MLFRSQIRDAQPKEAVQTVASYRNGEEAIAIQQYPNGQFYNHYGFNEQSRFAAATAGGFASFEEAEAALRSHRPQAERVMEGPEEVHAEPVSGTEAGQTPGDGTTETPEGAATPPTPKAEEKGVTDTPAPQVPAYQVGDTVYLDNTAFIVEEIGLFDVQLRDPALAYPIFRAESKERLERMLRADERNAHLFAPEVGEEQDDPRGNSE